MLIAPTAHTPINPIANNAIIHPLVDSGSMVGLEDIGVGTREFEAA